MMKIKVRIIVPFLVLFFSMSVILFFGNGKAAFPHSFIPISQKNISNDVQIGKVADDVNLLFVGDIMLDRYIRQNSEKYGYAYPFQKVEAILKKHDLVVGNLEGPITDNPSVSLASSMGERNNYIFTFDPKAAEILASENIKLVNIGNNHIGNFGSAGIESTRKNLAQSDIDFFGDPERSEKRIVIEKIKGFNIAFLNYNQFVPDAEQKIFEDIRKAKEAKVDLVIVYTHWGKEFVYEPGSEIRDLAHRLIDNGADLIIGSHPHVIQSKEEYKGKMVYYSLGNFVFDQYFQPETQKGLVVEAKINNISKKMEFEEQEVEMKTNGQTISLK